jgi:hypothetical protein
MALPNLWEYYVVQFAGRIAKGLLSSLERNRHLARHLVSASKVSRPLQKHSLLVSITYITVELSYYMILAARLLVFTSSNRIKEVLKTRHGHP